MQLDLLWSVTKEAVDVLVAERGSGTKLASQQRRPRRHRRSQAWPAEPSEISMIRDVTVWPRRRAS
eukprot:3775467-Pleurochrysis_carterae.AAC.1